MGLALVVTRQCEVIVTVRLIVVEDHITGTILTLAVGFGDHLTYIFARESAFKLLALVFLDTVRDYPLDVEVQLLHVVLPFKLAQIRTRRSLATLWMASCADIAPIVMFTDN